MKVHRIITTIEVENDNSITSVELTHLYPVDADIPLAITNLTTNGNANDIKQVYDSINGRRLVIASKLKGIAGNIAINDDKTSYISELRTTHLVKQDDVGMTVVTGIDTTLTQSGVRGESPIEPDGTSKTS